MSMTSPVPVELCSPDFRLERMRSLAEEWKGCNRCTLARHRNRLVFGEGSVTARIMFVGTGPGEEEDFEGRPFVGRSGTILNKLMEIVGLDREVAFLVNVVMCRPPENRDPFPDEMEACWPRLYQQVYIVDPLVIVPLGSVATTKLLGKKHKMSDAAGRFFTITLPGRTEDITLHYPVIPLHHPAWLGRNFDTSRGGPLHRTAQFLWDAINLADVLGRGYYGDKPSTRKERP